MPQSSSYEIRLRWVFQKPTPQMQRQMIYIKNKLLFNQKIMKELDVFVGDNFKYYFESAKQALEDYKSYVVPLLRRTEKTTDQMLMMFGLQ